MRVLIFTDLRERGVRYSREHIRRREKAGTFPLHIELGEGRIGWFEHEIDEWLARLGQARYETEAQVPEIAAVPGAEPKAPAPEWNQRCRPSIGGNATRRRAQSKLSPPQQRSPRDSVSQGQSSGGSHD